MIDPNTIIKLVWMTIALVGFVLTLVVFATQYNRRKVLLELRNTPLRNLELTQPLWSTGVRASMLFFFTILGLWAITIPPRVPGEMNPATLISAIILITIELHPMVATLHDLYVDTQRTKIVTAINVEKLSDLHE